MKDLGFTGTRTLLPKAQEEKLWDQMMHLQEDCGFDTLHHGQCVGADAVADDFARAMGYLVILHPPVNIDHLAYCERGPYDWHPKPYLTRNKDIVDCSQILIACPKGPEELRSGTWSTVRYAEQKGVKTIVILPNGKILEGRQ